MNPKDASYPSPLKDLPIYYRFLSWCVTLIVPVALVLSAMRLIMVPQFLRFEYSAPGFPQDYYGFSTQERLYWAEIALQYLLNDEDISFLARLKFPDGRAVYNPRELRHMEDVKNVVRLALSIWYISLTFLVATGLLSLLRHQVEAYRSALVRGGWLTALILGSIILFVLLSFNIFFVAFHNVFFDPGTWMFDYSDTLIRLFPERFWRDVFIYVGGMALLGALALSLGLRRRPETQK